MKVLIANRGEIAVRLARAAASVGLEVQHVHAAGAQPLSNNSVELPRSGPEAFLDGDALIAAAQSTGSTLLHPGYGFLSESSMLARACADAGITWVGPSPEVLDLFGDKGRAREFATAQHVATLASTTHPATDEAIGVFADEHRGGIMIKAVSGGGGRGMRLVTDPADLDDAIASCRAEALRAFGNEDLYAERLMANAKHIEIQIVGDGTEVRAVGDRECSIQRRRQKIIEVAPSPSLSRQQRSTLAAEAERLMSGIGYRGLATVEFLVDADALADELNFAFIEVNPRIQVEHTVTEEVTGLDLAAASFSLAGGATLDATLGEVGADRALEATGFALQARVNAEVLRGGSVVPTTGAVTSVSWPTSARVDTHVSAGTVVDGTFDSLLAKVIVTADDHATVCSVAATALRGLELDGVETNVPFLIDLLSDPVVTAGEATTTYVDEVIEAAVGAEATAGEVRSPMAGTIVRLAEPGLVVGPRSVVATIEAMKMEHPIHAGATGTIAEVDVTVGDVVEAESLLARISVDVTAAVDAHAHVDDLDLDHVRPDLAEVLERRELTRDSARTEAVAKRHARGHLTAREHIERLVDPGSFVEYGTFPVAAQRRRRELDDLIRNTPADGIVTGIASINAETAQQHETCALAVYDYTVLAGTQGYFNHRKTDRILDIAQRRGLPVILFAEGGGGRPGDVDVQDILSAGLGVTTFTAMGSLSGRVPLIGVLTGKCFAGNAALLGSCDVIIATEDSNLGMAGPAMIEGGGLGSYSPEDIGPMSVQSANGVVDVVVADDAEAIDVAQRYLSYFQGTHSAWTAGDRRVLRHAIGENRKSVYDIRALINALVDTNSWLELRRGFGPTIVTGLVRIEGRPMGLIANDPAQLGGAIDADGAVKLDEFMQRCNDHGLPIVSLCDTPGFMVGPDSEQQATVRKFSHLFVTGAQLDVPLVTIVLRKAYGLGAQAMAGGGFTVPLATVSWPTGELGGMGLEGAVRLGFAKELELIADPIERQERFDELVATQYEQGKALVTAMKHEIDEVIDPADTREWITRILGD